MSDGITDAERLKREEVERWRKIVKEQFVSELSTKELADELCKRKRTVECIPVTAGQLYASIETRKVGVDELHSKREFASPVRILVVIE